VSPLFFPKTDNLFSRSPSVCLSVLQCHPYLFSPEKLTTFLLINVTFIDLPWRVSPTPFLLVRPRLSTILYKFTHNIFFVLVSPPEWRHPGRLAPSPSVVTPLHVGGQDGPYGADANTRPTVTADITGPTNHTFG